MAAKGDPVKYRAMAGDTYDAVVVSVGPGAFVDIDIVIPGCRETLSLRAIRWSDNPEAAGSGARPIRQTGQPATPGPDG